jgi:transmembrane sensor
MGERLNDADSAVLDEAAKWFSLLRGGGASPEDRRAFEIWRGAHPGHAAANEHALSVWEDIGELDDLKALASAPEFGRQQQRPLPFIEGFAGRKLSKRRFAYSALAAAAATLVFVLVFVVYAQPAWLLPNVHATRTAETAQIALPDGSAADLAPRSKVRVAYSGEERRIVLKRGEAFFDVHKGDARAFVVVSGDAEVRVTGTKFNVRQGPAGVTVSVAEGEVRVRRVASRNGAGNSAAEERLSAGEQVAAPASGDGLSSVIKAPAVTIGAWRAGRLTYKNAPLREFIADANRYSRIPIVAADDRLLDFQLVASLRTDQFDAMIDGLPDILPLEVDRSRRDRIVLRPAAGDTR